MFQLSPTDENAEELEQDIPKIKALLKRADKDLE